MNSRVHRLNTFDFPGVAAYVKREDELSFGVSGPKLRKYSSLIPYLLEQKIEEAVLAGGAYSNHLLSLSQLLREKKIEITIFIGGRKPVKPMGNLILTSLIVPPQNIHWTASGEEEKAAALYVQKRQSKNIRAFFIPIGARMQASIPGGMSLVDDLIRNEQELGIHFDHIFIDSGTGTTAVTAILGYALLGKTTHFHVIQIASTFEKFHMLIENFRKELPHISSPLHFTLYKPETARSFGAINASVWKTIAHMARHEGFFVDPVYNAKLFSEGRKILQRKEIKGNVLFIHSGGCFALSGFMEKLRSIHEKEVEAINYGQ